MTVTSLAAGAGRLLAQTTFDPTVYQQPTPQPSAAETAIGFAVIGLIIVVVWGILIAICYLLYKAQSAIPPEHQKIPPGQIWLLLIPLFNIVWNFIVFQRIPESFQSYFHSRGRGDVGDAGKQLGLWFAICYACSIIPCVGTIAGLAGLVLLVMFLVKVWDLKKQVEQGGMGPGAFPAMPPPQAPPQM